MEKTLDTPCGKVRIGSLIRIDMVFVKTTMFHSGIDEQAKRLAGKTGRVEHIEGENLRGTWDSLGVLADKDRFTVLEY